MIRLFIRRRLTREIWNKIETARSAGNAYIRMDGFKFETTKLIFKTYIQPELHARGYLVKWSMVNGNYRIEW